MTKRNRIYICIIIGSIPIPIILPIFVWCKEISKMTYPIQIGAKKFKNIELHKNTITKVLKIDVFWPDIVFMALPLLLCIEPQILRHDAIITKNLNKKYEKIFFHDLIITYIHIKHHNIVNNSLIVLTNWKITQKPTKFFC